MTRVTITKNNIPFFKSRKVRAKLEAGLETAALRGEELYRAAVTEKVHPNAPVGPFFDEDSSAPGEYPAARTFQGADSIASGLDARTLRARFGVVGKGGAGPRVGHKVAGGLHLIHLTTRGRLGPVEIIRDHRAEIARAFVQGARAVR